MNNLAVGGRHNERRYASFAVHALRINAFTDLKFANLINARARAEHSHFRAKTKLVVLPRSFR